MTEITGKLSAALADRYRIESHLGEGGMATVYLAEDLKHKRKVAVKVLRPELAAVLGAERFIQEITTTANLQHPHILPLHDSGDADGFLYYVMPFIDGETIRDKLNRETQFGIEEAVKITTEVADALDYAHRQGVIHRDIKPENILLHDGRPMVADFGIALAVSAAAGGRMTETGLSLGTPHYMSPEQATAEKDLTNRSDIYSLGSVLYEMLAGEPPHLGNSAQQIIMKIVTDTPRPVTDLRKSVPPNVAGAVAKSLEKLAADRFESAAAFAAALGDPAFTTPTRFATHATGPRKATNASRLTMILSALVVTLLATTLWGWLKPAHLPTYLLDLDVTRAGFDPEGTNDIEISPDGTTIMFTSFPDGVPGLYVRRLDESEYRRIPGSEDARSNPRFSPDGQWAIFSKTGGQIVKFSLTGLGETVLTAVPGMNPTHPQWGHENTAVFFSGRQLYTIDTDGGGTPKLIGEHEPTITRPFLLPDGSGVLVGGEDGIRLIDVATGAVTSLTNEGYMAEYVASGHILYVTASGNLLAAPFDLRRREITDRAVTVWQGLKLSGRRRGFSVSQSGTLIVSEGTQRIEELLPSTLQIVYPASGVIDTLDLPAGTYAWPRFSPNGRRIAYFRVDGGRADIWTIDLDTRDPERLTFEGDNRHPAWSPDGQSLVFQSRREGSDGVDLYVKPADNSGPAGALVHMPDSQRPEVWLDERIVFGSYDSGHWELYILNPDSPDSPTKYEEETVGYGWGAALSPDRTLLAFGSNRVDDVFGIWIREFPQPSGLYQVSTRMGFTPAWSPDGKSLYYWVQTTGPDSLKAVTVDRSAGVRIRDERTILVTEYRGFDVHPDGDRFVIADGTDNPEATMTTGNESPTASRFVVVINWFEELRNRTGTN